MRPGPRNLITDVASLTVGNAQDATLKSGVTVLTADAPFVASVSVMGGAPGTRDIALLEPDKTVQQVDALVLSGGSAFGLDAVSGVMDGLRAVGRGFAIGAARVPIVPGAILFDLLNGGDKGWDVSPYPALGRAAFDACDPDFRIGSAGAGMAPRAGATGLTLKGGLGSASVILDNGMTVGALVAVNALGQVTVGDGPHFWAAPFEMEGEFGGLGPSGSHNPAAELWVDTPQGSATTIAIVATDAALTQAQAKRLATAAHDGLARAIVPAHTALDGDLVFACATGAVEMVDVVRDGMRLGHAAAICLSRAVARAVYAARPAEGDIFPTWSEMFAPDL
ncbi:P1 family peptidase [Actibacterium sp. 188UL27-1]|uniref:P1 family peptidase n=1 Tax=Actibacterium sp. 188UL27-1 TaxID=2786961 RepID=UPI0019577779|nr:P1 family peptidase [Actibacterium sp. 188UL27-1]MBM7066392.1 P1 family peptidase [Actibacterium sp. 188UL27-1]